MGIHIDEDGFKKADQHRDEATSEARLSESLPGLELGLAIAPSFTAPWPIQRLTDPFANSLSHGRVRVQIL